MLDVFGQVLSLIIKGIALSVIWGWFMVPTFALPEVNALQAIGMVAIFRLLAGDPIGNRVQGGQNHPAMSFDDFMNRYFPVLESQNAVVVVGVCWIAHAILVKTQ